MECHNCGSPLEQEEKVCAFCGCVPVSQQVADVPLQHQRGEGRFIPKTYDDSLQSIQESVEYSRQVHKGEKVRFAAGVLALIVVLASPMLFTLYFGYQANKPPIEFEEALELGVELVERGAYKQAKQLFLQAVQTRPDSVEGRLVSGSSFYAEYLEKPYLDEEKKAKLLAGVHREMYFVLGVQPDDPQANFFMGLARYEKGELSESLEHFETTLAHLSEIPDASRAELYKKTTQAILSQLKAPGERNLNLYSEVDDTLTVEQADGIEVPLGR